ncbi:MAG: MFS transporter, partial [Acidimicrobiales bacterium]
MAQARTEARGCAPRLRWCLFALILVTGVLQNSVAPLLPAYGQHFGLSTTEIGLLIGASGLSMLAVTLPAGSLADRFGARRLTLVAGWVLVVSALGQAAAPSFSSLLIARLLFGAGYGVLWTAGLAWLSSASEQRGRTGISSTVVFAGLGAVIGPVFAGMLAQPFGLAAPFLISGVLVALATLALTAIRTPEVSHSGSHLRVASAMRMVAGDMRVVTSIAAVVIAGILYSVTTLFDPLELHRDGWSSGAIGAMFSVGAILYVVGALSASAIGKRLVTIVGAVTLGLLGAATLLPGGLSIAPVAVVGVLLASSAVRSALWSVAYPLGESGAEVSGAGIGVVLGILNGVSAATSMVAPLAAGTMADSFGLKGAFDLSVVACIGILGCWWLY